MAECYGAVPALLREQVGNGATDDVAATNHGAATTCGGYVVIFEQRQNTIGGCGQIRGEPRNHTTGVHGVETVNVLARVDSLDNLLLRDVAGQGQLHDETVNLRIGVQLVDTCEQLLFGCLFGHTHYGRGETTLVAALLFVRNVSLARSIVTHQNRHQMGRGLTFGYHSLYFGCNLTAHCRSNLFTIDNSHSFLYVFELLLFTLFGIENCLLDLWYEVAILQHHSFFGIEQI